MGKWIREIRVSPSITRASLYGWVSLRRTDGHVIVRDLTSLEITRFGSQGLFLPLDGFDVRML